LPIRVIPVIDLQRGKAVHARGGRRASYQAVRGVLASGDDPLALALAFRDVLGLRDLYLADLDAIAGGPPDLGFVSRAAESGLHVWVDAGIKDASLGTSLESAGACTLIAATETLGGRSGLQAVARRARVGSLVFGLDLNGGLPLLAPGSEWASSRTAHLIDAALEVGIRRILILDTARVGSGTGVGALPVVRDLLARHPEVEVTVGGGLASKGDLRTLEDMGVSAVLVASALHDGRLAWSDLHDDNAHSTSAD
jgi:phosphoribosylformimino-5-aminoimidazole carboxamide ribotide isomerase